MSQENVELVRRAFEAYEREGVPAGVAAFARDVVWHPAEEAPQHGIDAALAHVRRWEAEWDDLLTVPEEFIDAGDVVLVAVRFSGRGKASGVEVTTVTYQLFTVRDGKIVRMDEFTERAEALEAAGLSA